MAAPDFVPVPVAGLQWESIGSGARTQRVRELAQRESLGPSQVAMMQGEVMNPGGYAMTVAHTVAYELFHDPLQGVSDLLQVGIARVTGPVIRGLMTHYNVGEPSSTVRNTPQDICTSWVAFEERSRSLRVEPRASAA
jgi:hypothetical protein